MKVSVITAVYNGESSIATTLASVAAQDHPVIEHIVIDGASSDSTRAQVDKNATDIVRLFSEEDMGVYDAFNKGLRRATGDVVAFLNCGDTYTSSDVVSRMAEVMSREDIGAAFADVLITDFKDRTRVIRRYSSRHFSPRNMAYGLMPAHPSLFVRREVYNCAGEFDPSFVIAGDFELCLRMFCAGSTRYYYLNEAIVNMATGGLSNRGWRSKVEITREMYRACAANGVRTNLVKLCMRFPLKMLEII